MDEAVACTVADPADNADMILEKKEGGELVRQASINLSPKHREIIDLVYYHEKSIDEVAQVLGVPSATVKTRMFYARQKLAELIKMDEEMSGLSQ